MRRARPAVLNLCFHGIGQPQRALEPDEERYWIAPDAFEGMLDVIAAAGDTARITFDDGNASDVELALPAMARRGLSGSFFVIAGRCVEPGSVSLDGVRELARSGMTVGSHGLRHRPWSGLAGAELEEELVEAPRLLAEAVGGPVRHAACPFGVYDRRALAALRRHGFERVYTVDEGPADPDAWLQSRYTIRREDTPERVEALIRDPGDGLGRSLRLAVKRWR